jgi:1-acyl-sn-glycerol-3-phosphate acyltransferase
MILKWLKNELIERGLTPEQRDRLKATSVRLNSAGMDDWGLDPETAMATAGAVQWAYRDYFRVEASGLENVPTGRVLLIANHGGQLPIDGFVIGMAMALDANPPRMVRGMVERWFPSLPFISTLLMRCGQMVGDINNCKDLLLDEQCVLVFPEGVRGSGKPYRKRYQLQRFGTGFLRLALETQTPIVPVAVIGAEETYPAIGNLKSLAKLLRAPYFPVTPLFPLFGPLGAVPLPAKIYVRFGKPLRFEGDPDAPDAVVQEMVDEVRSALMTEIQEGLRRRAGRVFLPAPASSGTQGGAGR